MNNEQKRSKKMRPNNSLCVEIERWKAGRDRERGHACHLVCVILSHICETQEYGMRYILLTSVAPACPPLPLPQPLAVLAKEPLALAWVEAARHLMPP